MVGLVIHKLRLIPGVIIFLSDNAILLSDHLLILSQVELLLHDVFISILTAIAISQAPRHVRDLSYGHSLVLSNLNLHLIGY